MGQTIDPQKPTRLVTPRILLMHTARLTAASLVLLSAHAFGIGVQQSGASNTTSVEQISLLYVEKSTINQIGDSNDTVLLQQGSGVAEQMLVTHVTQTGDLNAARITQRARQGQVVVQQTGTQNQANVEQEEVYNGSVEILQTGTSNLAEVSQLPLDDGSSPHASIVQNGSDNVAVATQHMFSDDDLEIFQEGTGNIVHVQHGEGYMDVYDRDSDIYVEMIGDANEAYIAQQRAHGGSLADISYIGSGNILNLEQAGETARTSIQSVNSDNNEDWIVQGAGGGVDIRIERENTTTSRVTSYQSGMYFDAYARQTDSAGAVAEFQQEEDIGVPKAEIYQSSVIDSFARIEQSAAGSGLIIQDGVEDSYALIQMRSSGETDMIIVQMGGTGNQGEITMNSDLLAHALIDQLGSFNEAQITHSLGFSGLESTGMTASITQIGDYNQAVITQSY